MSTYQYLNGNGINAVFISKLVSDRLTCAIKDTNRKQNNVSLTHRRWDLKRLVNVTILGTDGVSVIGTEAGSVTITVTGSTRDAMQTALGAATSDLVAFLSENWKDCREKGISPRLTAVNISSANPYVIEG